MGRVADRSGSPFSFFSSSFTTFLSSSSSPPSSFSYFSLSFLFFLIYRIFEIIQSTSWIEKVHSRLFPPVFDFTCIYLFHLFTLFDVIGQSSKTGRVADLMLYIVKLGYARVNVLVANSTVLDEKGQCPHAVLEHPAPPLPSAGPEHLFMNWGFSPTDEVEPLSRAVLKYQTAIQLSLLTANSTTGSFTSSSSPDHDSSLVHSSSSSLLSANLYCATLLSLGEDVKKLHNANVLEVGCGRGGGAIVLHAISPSASYTGVDMTENGIQFCKHVNRNANANHRRNFVVGKAEQLLQVLQPHSFHFVLNVESSHCYRDCQRFANGVYDVLMENGVLLWADQCADSRRSLSYVGTLAERLDCFQKAGLVVERIFDIRANVKKALNEGSLTSLERVAKSQSWDWVEHVVVWYGMRVRPQMLMLDRLDYHIVVLRKPGKK